MATDTIFAVATGASRAGVAIIRVSGPHSGKALESITYKPRPAARVARWRRLKNEAGQVIDEGLVLWFASPASFTGEDVAEFHVHGGPAVVEGVLETLAGFEGLRPAEAGEFTRRAFENGKLDLTAAEGLADLVDAETGVQRDQALRQMQGELAALYDGWRGRLLETIGHLEATIDFSDEDLPEGVEKGVLEEIAALEQEIGRHLEEGARGERIRAGIHIAIIGPPNAGKSSLFNALAKREAAIVSRHPGTTRDVIEVPLDIGGFPVVLADTAGIRDAAEEVEGEGVRRAHAQARSADLRLAVFDGAVWPTLDEQTQTLVNGKTIVVVNKADLGRVGKAAVVGQSKAVVVSAKSGDGLSELFQRMEQEVRERFRQASAPAWTRVRHRRALEESYDALRRCVPGMDAELAAEDLRLGARALGRITGRVDVEEVLDVIFREFCIGK